MKLWRPRFKHASIETKLQLINLASTSVALVLVFVFVVINEYWLYRQNIFENLHAQAKMISENIRYASVYRDNRGADEILSSLQYSPEISSAEIILADGTPFAKYHRRQASSNSSFFSFLHSIEKNFFKLQIAVQEKVEFEAAPIGTLTIHADLPGLWQSLSRYIAITLTAALLGLVLAWLLLQQLKTAITRPLSKLTDLMRKVSGKRDFSIRSPVESRDEIGLLAACFNEMLEQIQSRDSSLRDELSERKKAEERLDRLAFYDTVTGLPNRHFFNERLAHSVHGAKAFGESIALMFIDLDDFKIINDTLGHDTGDMLLASVGERLSSVLRNRDFIFRIGGDEFAVILESVGSRSDLVAVAEKIIQVLSSGFVLAGHEMYIGASIGVSLCPDDATDTYTLLKNADTAMYHAKEHGKNTFQFFQAVMKGKAQTRLTMENKLRRSLEKEEFILEYQPQFDLSSGHIFGVEALVRWVHPELGLVSPGEFIPIAEETGLIVALGEWVLRQACHQAAIWQMECIEPPILAVNLSGRQFKDEKLVDKVLQIVLESGLNPKLLELELTESTVMDGSRSNMEKLMRLRGVGIRFSIDDFGTGYSSMSYLKRFPISTLKIDQSFIDGIPENVEDVAIATAIIALGKSLNMQLLAEGVETREQADFLQNNGCPHIQGFFFSKPLSADKISILLHTGNIGLV